MIEETIQELEKDIIYFKNLGFDNMVMKLEKYLQCIKSLQNNNNVDSKDM